MVPPDWRYVVEILRVTAATRRCQRDGDRWSAIDITTSARHLLPRSSPSCTTFMSKETLCKLMMAHGLWTERRARRARVYQPRYRRDCLGELIQIDGSTHWWFEDRGPKASLLVFIDDATSRLMQLMMVPTESAFAYMQATRAYIEAHGKPVAFYSDTHSVFRVHAASAKRSDGMS